MDRAHAPRPRRAALALLLLLTFLAVLPAQPGEGPGGAKAKPTDAEVVARLVKAKRVAPTRTRNEKQRGDDPMAAAKHLRKLRGAAEGGDPLTAMPRAIERVREMRAEVATRAGVRPAVLAALSARGVRIATVAGIPVGPLPADSTEAAKITLNALNYKALAREDVTTLEKTVRPLALPLSSQITPGGWVWLGPGNVGGRTRAALIHPNDPRIMWVAGVSGGIWSTADGGASWGPYRGLMASLVVSCLALNPKNPDDLFAGTGEGFYNLDAMRGVGIFRSTNGGGNWALLDGTRGSEDFRWVNRVAVPASGEGLLAATRTGLFVGSSDGATFTRAKLAGSGTSSSPFKAECLDVRVHPSDKDRAVAAGRNGKAWYSKDGGATWWPAKGLPAVTGSLNGRVELTYAAADPKVVYASVDEHAFDRAEFGQTVPYYGVIYRSTDGGESYTRRKKQGHLAQQGWYANCIWAGDNLDPNLVVVGGLDLHRSADGGTTFDTVSDWENTPTSPHADHHVILSYPGYDGTDNRRVLFGSDGGLYVADDVLAATKTSGWRGLNRGLGITQFYGAAANPKARKVIAGSQDNGTLIFTEEQSPSVPNMGIHGWKD
ncbi:MAG: WD40/YVTN/BNR-like repeat-containing protein, partial [Gemmataceae bacterium]